MPGRRYRTFRSGDVHENLGIALLMGVGFVAPVPRSEDIGFDVVVTLIRPGTGKYLIPEDSFCVQLKAASQRAVNYLNSDAVAWLRKLELPLFIGSVEMSSASLTLYPTHNLSQSLLSPREEKIRLTLKPSRPKYHPMDARLIEISHPALTWSARDLCSAAFQQKAYTVLKGHIVAHQRNIRFRKLGYCEAVAWEPGEPPAHAGTMMMSSPDEDDREVLEALVAPLLSYLMKLRSKRRFSDLPALLGVMEMMRERGVDPDPGDWHKRITLMSADGDDLSEEEIVRLRSLANPGELDLTGTRITDAALDTIPRDTIKLSLAKTKVTDEGMKHLKGLHRLERLNLAETQITDCGISELLGMSTLVWINLTESKVSKAGPEKLRREVPGIEIVR